MSMLRKKPTNQSTLQTIPEIGFMRLPEVLSVFPVSATVWWEGIREGRYPKGIKLSARTTAWRVEAIRELVQSVSDAA
jgi:prophage regulatory protein